MIKSLVLGTSLVLAGLIGTYRIKNPGFNNAATVTVQQAIYDNNPIHQQLVSAGTPFDVQYVPRSSKEACNPGFPSIHITTTIAHNGWLHIVSTDALSPAGVKGWMFIDAQPDHYPFYTRDQDFYDAPCWNSTFLHKPLSTWHGHVYPVMIDDEKGTFQLQRGGVLWGFEIPVFGMGPRAIVPRALSDEQIAHDMAYLASKGL